jgi:hypothetical protein
MKTLLVLLLLAVPVQAQTIKNFDTDISFHNSNVVIQPPPGTTWILKRGSFGTPAKLYGVGVVVYEQYGEEPGLCTNIIQVGDLGDTHFIPVVGGYAAHWNGTLRGVDAPIELVYPMRLVIHFSRLRIQEPVKLWVRFTVDEITPDTRVTQSQ